MAASPLSKFGLDLLSDPRKQSPEQLRLRKEARQLESKLSSFSEKTKIVNQMFGDGRKLLRITSNKTWPHAYVVRVDSKFDHEMDSMREIESALREQFGVARDPMEKSFPAFAQEPYVTEAVAWPNGMDSAPTLRVTAEQWDVATVLRKRLGVIKIAGIGFARTTVIAQTVGDAKQLIRITPQDMPSHSFVIRVGSKFDPFARDEASIKQYAKAWELIEAVIGKGVLADRDLGMGDKIEPVSWPAGAAPAGAVDFPDRRHTLLAVGNRQTRQVHAHAAFDFEADAGPSR